MNIARLTGCEVLLPSAFLACCLLNEELVCGFKREDGTQETLSLQDFRLCIEGVRALPEYGASLVIDICEPPTHASCKTPKKCRNRHKELLETIWQCDTISIIRPTESFEPWNHYVADRRSYWAICRHCRNVLKRKWIHSQQYNWDELPKTFGIELKHWGTEIKMDNIDDDVSNPEINRRSFTYMPIPQLTLSEQYGEVDDD